MRCGVYLRSLLTIHLRQQLIGITPHSSCSLNRSPPIQNGGKSDDSQPEEVTCIGDDGCSAAVSVDVGLGFADVAVAA